MQQGGGPLGIIGGEFRLAETGDVTRVLRRRLLGWRRYAPWAALAILGACLFLMTAVVDAVTPADLRPSTWVAAAGTLCVLTYYLWASWWRAVILRAWRRRGVPDPMPIRVETTNEAMLFAVGEVTTRLPWAEVSELTLSRTRWVVVAHYSAWGIPRRFFHDAQAERAFVADILSRLSDQARARSGEAAAFAAGTA